MRQGLFKLGDSGTPGISIDSPTRRGAKPHQVMGTASRPLAGLPEGALALVPGADLEDLARYSVRELASSRGVTVQCLRCCHVCAPEMRARSEKSSYGEKAETIRPSD